MVQFKMSKVGNEIVKSSWQSKETRRYNPKKRILLRHGFFKLKQNGRTIKVTACVGFYALNIRISAKQPVFKLQAEYTSKLHICDARLIPIVNIGLTHDDMSLFIWSQR